MRRIKSLRSKAAVTLAVVSLLILLPTTFLAWQGLEEIRGFFAGRLAERHTALQMERIRAPVVRELALSRRLAASLLTREWMAQPEAARRQQRFLEEAAGFRDAFADDNYFAVVRSSGHYYAADPDTPRPTRPLYQLDPDDAADAWFYHSLENDAPFNININYDRGLDTTKVWFNVLVEHDGRRVGLTGTGLDLTGFLDAFTRNSPAGIEPLIIDRHGAIQVHPDRSRIAISSGALEDSQAVARDKTIRALVGDPGAYGSFEKAMERAREEPGRVAGLQVLFSGKAQHLAVGYLPQLEWYVVSALDPTAARVLEPGWMWALGGSMAGFLLVLLGAVLYTIDRLIVAPLRELQGSARAVTAGNYQLSLPEDRGDEIGALSTDFATMAERIARYTRGLEAEVRERTRDLEASNHQLVIINERLSTAIEYAALIQRSVLPDPAAEVWPGITWAVLWRPRDTVGGDFYYARQGPEGHLLGVVDCAGHGVAGALMTMLARAVLDEAVDRNGAGDPAAVLATMDSRMRELLGEEGPGRAVTTTMDVGLVHIGRESLTWSGAKMHLYASDGKTIATHPGSRRPVGHRRAGVFENTRVALAPGWTYYLASDGFADQAGGDAGLGFGSDAFRELLRCQRDEPVDDKVVALEAALEAHQGDFPQRDDITVLAFTPYPPDAREQPNR